MKRISIIILMLISQISWVSAQSDCSDIDHIKQLKSVKTCFSQLDHRLNQIYQKALQDVRKIKHKVDTGILTLRNGQRAWIQLRDAQCALAASQVNTPLKKITKLKCKAALTQKRTYFLKTTSDETANNPRCLTHSKNLAQLKQCHQHIDQSLNQVYQKLCKKLARHPLKLLKQSQRAWINIRDWDSGFKTYLSSSNASEFISLDAHTSFTYQRTKELEQMLKGVFYSF